MDERTVLIIRGTPVAEYDPEMMMDAFAEAKRLAEAEDAPHMVVTVNSDAPGLVFEVVLTSKTTTDYLEEN